MASSFGLIDASIDNSNLIETNTETLPNKRVDNNIEQQQRFEFTQQQSEMEGTFPSSAVQMSAHFEVNE